MEKTTFLGAVTEYIPKDERLITIEDNAELKIRGIDNLVCLEAKMANMAGAVSVNDPRSDPVSPSNETG